MFSSDKNIETIAQLVEQLKQYGGLKLEMLKLDATEKTVKIISALILGFVLLLIVCAVAICASFAVAIYFVKPDRRFHLSSLMT